MTDLEVIQLISSRIGLEITANREDPASYIIKNNKVTNLHISNWPFDIDDIIYELQQLNTLSGISFQQCKIQDVTPLGTLHNLTSVNLINNEINDLSSLAKLSKLKVINFSQNKVDSIQFVSELPDLKTIWLYGNKVKNINALSTLHGLKELGLGGNKVKDFKPLNNLQNLIGLQLSDCKLSDINTLPNLKKLKYLWLNDNNIKDVNPLEKFDSLTQIYLQDNLIQEVPEWIIQSKLPIDMTNRFHHLEDGIYLSGNPITTPPIEIVRQGNDAIIAWSKGKRSYVNEAKVLLVGHGEVGKTTLVKCLTGQEPDPNECATHNIKIQSDNISYKGKRVKLNYWDFGGQEVMHSTHQFFLSKRSVYILVLDGRRDEDAEYWLKHIESFGGNSPVLIVMNKIDSNPTYDVNRQFLQKKYPFIVGFYKTTCKPKSIKGVTDLKKGILSALENIELLKQEWPETWLTIKRKLEESKEDIMSQTEYERICKDQGIEDLETKEILADYLNDLGVIVHFKEIKLNDLHILQPRWASRAAYKIINCPKIAESQGLLDTKWMSEIMQKENTQDFDYHPSTYSYILELLQKFELCYPLNNGKQFLIPELMGIQQPKLPKMSSPLLRFYFQYEGLLPRSILPRFIVRMHEDIYKQFHWRTGVVLDVPIFKSRALIIADLKEKRIYVTVSGQHNREHFAIIRKAFYSLHNSFEKLNVTEWIPLPNEQHAIEYEELVGYEEAGKDEYFVGKLQKSYNVTKLLNGIEMESERRAAYKWDVFICHSSKDKPIIKDIIKNLEKLKITYWFDEEQIEPGDGIIDKITDGLSNSKMILPCLSKNQIASGWCRKEYQTILGKIIGGLSEQRVIPFILDDMPDQKVPLFLSDLRIEKYQDKDEYQRLLNYLEKNKRDIY